jgi:hypothetical protein
MTNTSTHSLLIDRNVMPCIREDVKKSLGRWNNATVCAIKESNGAICLSSRQVSIPNELSMTNTSTHSLLIDEFLRFVCKTHPAHGMHNFLNGIEHKLEDLVADFADKTQKFIHYMISKVIVLRICDRSGKSSRL